MASPRHIHWQSDLAILAASRNSPSLKQGMTGSGVQRLREALVLIGAPVVAEPPLLFGPLTRSQVAAFQSLYQLASDGAAGTATIGKLEELLQNPARRKPWQKSAHTHTGSREEFLQNVARECGPLIKQSGLPVSSMLACAAVESGWGNGPIYRETNNLFSLQKWPWVQYPTTERTLWRPTIIQTSPVKTALAPFNTALDLADAGRQWCEWILHYGAADGPPGSPNQRAPKVANAWAIGRRTQLLGMTSDPTQFARHLYLVSFGESPVAGALYSRVLLENNLTRFD
jgi:hypothetical protein